MAPAVFHSANDDRFCWKLHLTFRKERARGFDDMLFHLIVLRLIDLCELLAHGVGHFRSDGPEFVR